MAVYHIFCDESRQSAERYMVLGGMIISQNYLSVFDETMAAFREKTKMFAELKWTKVSNQKIEEYKTFIEYFFALNNSSYAHFHCMIVDNNQVDHKRYSGGDKEAGFYKFYYQFILNCFARNYPNVRFIVHLDYRNSSYSLDNFKDILNNGAAKKLGNTSRPFVAVEPIDSKKSEVVQLNDILLGAVGYQKNGLHLIPTGKESKRLLAAYIASSAGLRDLSHDTHYGQIRFKIWNIRLRDK